MRIVLLRHEKRYIDPGFFTSLTTTGLIKSDNLVDYIEYYKPDVIYSSPFLRTIQTIRPYAIQKNKKIRIDYSLYEYIHAEEFTNKNYKHHVTELEPEIYKDIIDDYEPIIQPEEIKYNESEEDIKKRVYQFIEIIKERHHSSTVLIVSHMSTLNMIRNYYDNTTQLEDMFPMGSLTVLV
jgi:2,3-bisphosphoglycerate-dependent phosphoglycerate mutase